MSDAGAIDVAALIPHAGAMVLLHRVEAWDADGILCRARSHLHAANPLRRDGRLSACCGLEYALQAAALHGAVLRVERRDVASLGELRVAARLERQETAGIIYALAVEAADGTPLLSGRATVVLPA